MKNQGIKLSSHISDSVEANKEKYRCRCCSLCGRAFFDDENCDYINDIGHCLGCDHVIGETPPVD